VEFRILTNITDEYTRILPVCFLLIVIKTVSLPYRHAFSVQVWMSLLQTCTLNGHLYRVTYTRCRIDTKLYPDDGHMAARNMQRIEINIHKKDLCVKLVIYKDF
jgi:hypothetical protein